MLNQSCRSIGPRPETTGGVEINESVESVENVETHRSTTLPPLTDR